MQQFLLLSLLACPTFKTTPSYGSPDTAFALGPLLSPKPSVDVLVLLRWDMEKSQMEENVTAGWLQQKFGEHNLTVISRDWVYNYPVVQDKTAVSVSVGSVQ